MLYVVEFFGNKGWEISLETTSKTAALARWNSLMGEGCARLTFLDNQGDSFLERSA